MGTINLVYLKTLKLFLKKKIISNDKIAELDKLGAIEKMNFFSPG